MSRLSSECRAARYPEEHGLWKQTDVILSAPSLFVFEPAMTPGQVTKPHLKDKETTSE